MGLEVEFEDRLVWSATELAPPSRAAETAAIASYIRTGRCVLFVGAGMSAGAGLPTWKQLMQRIVRTATPYAVRPDAFPASMTLVDDLDAARRDPLVRRAVRLLGKDRFRRLLARIAELASTRIDADRYLNALAEIRRESIERAELGRLLDAGRYQEVAARCRDRMGRGAFSAAVRAALTTARALPAAYRHIVRTPFSCVVTTNFDDLIERAYEVFLGHRPPAPTGAELDRQGDLLLRGAFFVLKAHGDLVTPDSLVFTADDYRRVVHANPAFQAVMSGILMTNAVVFVGYSLSDVDFRLLLDEHLTTFRGRVPPRFAVMAGVGPAERDVLWRTARLRVLPYPAGRHAEVGAFLERLAALTATQVDASVRRATARPRPSPAGSRSADVLSVESDGERLQFELDVEDGRSSRRSLTAAGDWSGFDVLRARVQSTFRPAATNAEWNGRARAAVAALTRMVPANLRRALSARPAGRALELVTNAAAEPIPWEWTLVDQLPLALRTAVVRRPRELSRSARGRPRIGSPLRALIVGYAGDGVGRAVEPLPVADYEADHASRALAGKPIRAVVTRLSGPDALAARLIDELARGDYDVVHFGGHAWAEPDDGYLVLWDRVVLGTELAPLLSRRPPSLLVMSTHHTAFFPLDLDRDSEITPAKLAAPELHGEPAEDRGFTALAMRCGVASFVGCCGSMTDVGSARVMTAFYDRLARGDTVPEALRFARRSARRAGDDAGLFFVAAGNADFRLTAASRQRAAAKR